ncbi:MAG TPA: hypothetical protein VKM55_11850 [Candidatus Lokiarchaeia archaeon]|nr:hypothetical protein [Candidatus Lokiarchaeia archaeon]
MSARDAGTMLNVLVSVMVSVATCNTSRRAPASSAGRRASLSMLFREYLNNARGQNFC